MFHQFFALAAKLQALGFELSFEVSDYDSRAVFLKADDEVWVRVFVHEHGSTRIITGSMQGPRFAEGDFIEGDDPNYVNRVIDSVSE